MNYAKPFEPVETEKEVLAEAETGLVERWVNGWVDRLADGLVESQKAMLLMIGKNPHISKREMSEAIGINSSAIDKSIVSLKKKGILHRIGSSTDGYWQIVSPFSENDISRVSTEENGGLVEGWVDRLVEGLVESQKQILLLIAKKPNISKREMSETIGISSTAIDKNIIILKNKGYLNRIGSAKKGHWQVVPIKK